MMKLIKVSIFRCQAFVQHALELIHIQMQGRTALADCQRLIINQSINQSINVKYKTYASLIANTEKVENILTYLYLLHACIRVQLILSMHAGIIS